MTRHAPRLARPAATLTALLLAAGVLQTVPAAADPGDAPATAITVTVAAPGSTAGHSSADPLDLGQAPGSTALEIRVTNTGTEALRDLAATTTIITNGLSTPPACDIGSPEALQATSDAELPVGATVVCTANVNDVAAGTLHEDVTSVTVTGAETGTSVSGEASFFATARDASVTLGDRVWLDSNRDGFQDAGERGIEGVRLVLSGPDGDAGSQTTGTDGSYGFTQLAPLPAGSYTVRVDLTSPALAGLEATTPLSKPSAEGNDPQLDFGFAPKPVVTPTPAKASVRLGVDAPSTAVRGTTITVKGSIKRDGKAFKAPTVLELQRDGSSTWSTVATVRSTSKGALSVSLKADRSASFRYRFGGDRSTAAGTSAADHVAVRKAAVRLTVAAPGTVVKGTKATITGSVKREGRAYRTSTLLQTSTDGRRWTKVATVRSSSKGALSASVKPSRTASYRYHVNGNATTDAGDSRGDRVVVRKATVRLTVAAPGSVTKGKSVTVKGSIKREGKAYKTTTVLEFRAGSGAWKSVKNVRSTGKGALSASVKPSRTGSYRYHFKGNSTTDDGASRADKVTVKVKPPEKPAPKAYKNCDALVMVYPHGVGRSGATDNGGVTDFVRDTATYNLNTKSDRDKDGVACER